MKTRMIWIVMLAIAMTTLSGCKVKKCLQPERIVVTETRTEYKEVVRDSIVQIPADTSGVVAWFECDSLNHVYLAQINQLQGKRSAMSVNTATIGKAMVITADCVCDSLAIYLSMKDSYLKTTENESTKETVVVKERLKKWPWVLVGFILAVALRLAYVLYLKPKITKLWQRVK